MKAKTRLGRDRALEDAAPRNGYRTTYNILVPTLSGSHSQPTSRGHATAFLTPSMSDQWCVEVYHMGSATYVHTSNVPYHSGSPISLLFLQRLFGSFASNLCASNIFTHHWNVSRV